MRVFGFQKFLWKATLPSKSYYKNVRRFPSTLGISEYNALKKGIVCSRNIVFVKNKNSYSQRWDEHPVYSG